MIGKRVFETEEQLREVLANSDPSCPLQEDECVVLNKKYCRICRPTTAKYKNKKIGLIFWRKLHAEDLTPDWNKVARYTILYWRFSFLTSCIE